MNRISMVVFGCVLMGMVNVQADALVRGKLTDATTGAPLEAVTVHVLGTYEATISNPEGLFVLSIAPLPATVRFSHIGYRRQDMAFWMHGWMGFRPLVRSDLASLTHVPQYQDEVHHELGLSVNGLFNLFRVDFTRRLDTPGFYFSLGMARIF